MANRSREREIRLNFLLFIKIMFHILEKSGDELMIEQAKLVVFNCRQLSSDDMRQSVERHLKGLLGESIWNQAAGYTGCYLKRKAERIRNEPIRISTSETMTLGEYLAFTKSPDLEPTPIRSGSVESVSV
jgi:hypothetical protein